MVSNKKTRAIFINLSIKVARKFGFNGLGLDWEFLANKVDMSNLALLFKEWQKALVNKPSQVANHVSYSLMRYVMYQNL